MRCHNHNSSLMENMMITINDGLFKCCKCNKLRSSTLASVQLDGEKICYFCRGLESGELFTCDMCGRVESHHDCRKRRRRGLDVFSENGPKRTVEEQILCSCCADKWDMIEYGRVTHDVDHGPRKI